MLGAFAELFSLLWARFPLCRAVYLCRAFGGVFAVSVSLSWAFVVSFAVLEFFVVRLCLVTWQ
jgi:hypothetical protein